MTPRTMLDKIWDEHIVVPASDSDYPDVLYVDAHLLHEITSPQAFEGLAAAQRPVHRPDLTVAVEDHNVPTKGLTLLDATPQAREQIEAMRRFATEHGIRLLSLGSPDQGIVHVVGPELGLSQPGMIIVCGDSHTSTHGALGALAFGIGTSDVEHVLATQTLRLRRPRAMLVELKGKPSSDVSAKDVALSVIHALGTGGGQGCAIEYRGDYISSLSMESRMTLCNMSIEAGARAGMIAPDSVTFDYVRGRRYAPGPDRWDEAVTYWEGFCSDEDAVFSRTLHHDLNELTPFVTWGTDPSQGTPLSGRVPDPAEIDDAESRRAAEKALDYMGLAPGTKLTDVSVDVVFVGSCTNSRIEDLKAASAVLDGRRVAPGVRMLVVPGSSKVKAEAESLGLDEIFMRAGAEWRGSGCSMCVALNQDRATSGQRVASTSNRNFQGRQGDGARTHLVSPAVAAATAVRGRFAAPRDLG